MIMSTKYENFILDHTNTQGMITCPEIHRLIKNLKNTHRFTRKLEETFKLIYDSDMFDTLFKQYFDESTCIIGKFSFDFVVQDLGEKKRHIIQIVTTNENLHHIMTQSFPNAWYKCLDTEDINNKNVGAITKDIHEWIFDGKTVIRMYVTNDINKLLNQFILNLNKMRLHYIDNKIVCRIGASDLRKILDKHITVKENYKNLEEFSDILQKVDKNPIEGFSLYFPSRVCLEEPLSSKFDILKYEKIWRNYTCYSETCMYFKTKNGTNKIILHLIEERNKYKEKVDAIVKRMKTL